MRSLTTYMLRKSGRSKRSKQSGIRFGKVRSTGTQKRQSSKDWRVLYEFMSDVTATAKVVELPRSDGTKLEVRHTVIRGRNVVKLGDISAIKIGLQSGDNGRFYRIAPGVKGGAQKGGYIEVTKSQIVSDKALAEMTATEKA